MMQRRASVWTRLGDPRLTIVAGGLTALVGAGMIMTLVLGGWPSLMPFIVFGYGLFFFLIGLAAHVRSRRPSGPRAGRRASLVTLPIMIFGAVGWFALTGVKTRVTYPMVWSYGTPARTDGERHVVLRFRDFPNHFIGFYSNDVADYVATLPDSAVDVTFELTRDFGRVRAYNPIRIGALNHWRARTSYGGSGGRDGRSPW